MKRTITREFNEAGKIVKETIVEEDTPPAITIHAPVIPIRPTHIYPYPSPYISPTINASRV